MALFATFFDKLSQSGPAVRSDLGLPWSSRLLGSDHHLHEKSSFCSPLQLLLL